MSKQLQERWWYQFLRTRIVGLLYIWDGLILFFGLPDRLMISIDVMCKELEWLSRRKSILRGLKES